MSKKQLIDRLDDGTNIYEYFDEYGVPHLIAYRNRKKIAEEKILAETRKQALEFFKRLIRY